MLHAKTVQQKLKWENVSKASVKNKKISNEKVKGAESEIPKSQIDGR